MCTTGGREHGRYEGSEMGIGAEKSHGAMERREPFSGREVRERGREWVREQHIGFTKEPWCGAPLCCTGRKHSPSWSTFGEGYIASPRTEVLQMPLSMCSTGGDRGAHTRQIIWAQLLTVLSHRCQAPAQACNAFLGQNGAGHSVGRLSSS